MSISNDKRVVNGVFQKPKIGQNQRIQSFFHKATTPRSPPPMSKRNSIPPTPALENRSLSAGNTSITPKAENCVPLDRQRDTPLYIFRPRDPLFVYFDTETTGTTRGKDQIVELAGRIDVHQLEQLQLPAHDLALEFTQLVKPQVEISPSALVMHQINSEMLESEADFQIVFSAFNHWLQRWHELTNRDILLVAYNASFDVNMLMDEVQRVKGNQSKVFEQKHIRFACLMQSISSLFHLSSHLKLVQALRRFGALELTIFQKHRALNDCNMSMRLVHLIPDNELIYRELAHSSF